MTAARTGRAFIVSALTAISGVAVIAGSSLPLLRDFGLVVAMNVAVALLSALVVLPPILVWADERGWVSRGLIPKDVLAKRRARARARGRADASPPPTDSGSVPLPSTMSPKAIRVVAMVVFFAVGIPGMIVAVDQRQQRRGRDVRTDRGAVRAGRCWPSPRSPPAGWRRPRWPSGPSPGGILARRGRGRGARGAGPRARGQGADEEEVRDLVRSALRMARRRAADEIKGPMAPVSAATGAAYAHQVH